MDLPAMEKIEIICSICGNNHKTQNCNILQVKSHIQDNIMPSKARLTLPSILRIEKMSEGSDVIVAADNIKKGTQFGPFEASKVFTLNPEITFPLKLFTSNDYFSEYYLDTTNENECNWMMFVPSATNLEEQNLICFQENLKIFFVSIRDIVVGEFMKVWYSSFYGQKMNKDALTPLNKSEEKIIDINTLLKKQQNLIERDVWMCRFCNLKEKDVTKFAAHISQHYSMQVRKACEICKSVFLTHKGLNKHMRIVHANKVIPQTKEHEDNPRSVKQKHDTKDSMLGGPLLMLNDIITDSMDNTNLLLQQTDISRFDIHNIGNNDIMLDNDNLNLSVQNFIQDSDNFNFDIDVDKEQHICDICLKPFSKLKRLVQHLQKHTGKYACSECLVIFSRNENLQAHKCNIYKKELYKCTICEKKFSLKKYLSRHMQSIHAGKQYCSKCNKSYHSDATLREHNCSAIPESEKEKFPCLMCNKVFYRETYMKKHMRLHAPTKGFTHKNELFICEICAKIFYSSRNLKRHKKTHGQLSHNCELCNKSYKRVDTLKEHMISEHSSDTYTCPICNKESKGKRYLNIHMKTHAIRNKYQCTACNLKFIAKNSMLQHFKKNHSVYCPKCKQSECEHTGSVTECYECPICRKLMKLRSSLLRHLRKVHPNENVDNNTIKKITRILPISDKTTKTKEQTSASQDKNKQLRLKNSEVKKDITKTKRKNDKDRDINKIPEKLEALTDYTKHNENILNFNNIALDLDTGLAITNQEICLSMPELSEMDQDVTLSNNAYMLENGTIVEPTDRENVVVYIFDKK